MESFGEDAYLSLKWGAAMVKGFEGNDVGSKYNVASCMKHYIGYGSTTTGKDQNTKYHSGTYLEIIFNPHTKPLLRLEPKALW
jgi:beta-glucosidase-like glycosyl hydrolase